MLKIQCEITTISVILFGFIISNISANSLSQDDTDSIDNRKSFDNARKFVKNEIDSPATKFNSIKFNLDATKNVKIGQPISIVLSMENESYETHDVSTKLIFNAYQYTGTKIGLVKQTKANVTVGPKDFKIVNLDISWDDYKEIMMSTSIFKIICLCSVPKENFDYLAELDFSLIKPKIEIYAKKRVAVDEKIEATISFINPLSIKLTSGQFRVLAPGLEQSLVIKLNDIVQPHAVVTGRFISIPKRTENSIIIGNFESKELNGITGFSPIEVVPIPDDVNASY